MGSQRHLRSLPEPTNDPRDDGSRLVAVLSTLGAGHYAERAHTRLLMDADAGHLLRHTSYEELERVARRADTLEVPQISAALAALKDRARNRETVVQ